MECNGLPHIQVVHTRALERHPSTPPIFVACLVAFAILIDAIFVFGGKHTAKSAWPRRYSFDNSLNVTF